MTHPLLIACGLNPALRFKNKTLGKMAEKKVKHLIHHGFGKKIGSGFKKDPDLRLMVEPEMRPAVMPMNRRALKFRS